MKMKKLVAIGAAAAMSMAMCVNAFAAITVSSEDSKFGSYADGVAKLADDSAIDATHQWTVVIIDAEKENSNLQASDLYYINQGTSAEGFWVTNGMGTKVDLTTLVNETTTEKNFIIRIGGETITEAQGIIQVPFKITYSKTGDTPVTYTVGDTNGDKAIAISDVAVLYAYLLGNIEKFTLNEEVLPKYVADTNNDKEVSIADVALLYNKLLGNIENFPNPTYTLPTGTTADDTYSTNVTAQ